MEIYCRSHYEPVDLVPLLPGFVDPFLATAPAAVAPVPAADDDSAVLFPTLLKTLFTILPIGIVTPLAKAGVAQTLKTSLKGNRALTTA
jgi:hypothetical protein